MAQRADFENRALPHLDAVYRAALAICGRRDRADDLVQATFAKALAGFASYEDGTNCKAWLLQILRRTWLDELRHERVVGPTVPVETLSLPAEDSYEEPLWANPVALLESFSDEQVIAALLELPGDQRMSLFLTEVAGLSGNEAAEIMDVPVGTIKSRTCRARAAMRRALAAHAKDLGFGKNGHGTP
jgi:RNA polymerase sigma-70 factor (ECF subfamily)